MRENAGSLETIVVVFVVQWPQIQKRYFRFSSCCVEQKKYETFYFTSRRKCVKILDELVTANMVWKGERMRMMPKCIFIIYNCVMNQLKCLIYCNVGIRRGNIWFILHFSKIQKSKCKPIQLWFDQYQNSIQIISL